MASSAVPKGCTDSGRGNSPRGALEALRTYGGRSPSCRLLADGAFVHQPLRSRRAGRELVGGACALMEVVLRQPQYEYVYIGRLSSLLHHHHRHPRTFWFDWRAGGIAHVRVVEALEQCSGPSEIAVPGFRLHLFILVCSPAPSDISPHTRPARHLGRVGEDARTAFSLTLEPCQDRPGPARTRRDPPVGGAQQSHLCALRRCSATTARGTAHRAAR